MVQGPAGPQSHLKAHRGGTTSQFPHTVIGSVQLDPGPQSPAGCWLEATLAFLPHGPLPRGSFIEVSRPRRQESMCQQERACETEVTVFVT